MNRPDIERIKRGRKNISPTPCWDHGHRKDVDDLIAYIEELEARPEPCRHLNCEMVSGAKDDYLYCRDCEERLDGQS